MAAAIVLLPTLSLTSFQAATADPQPAPRQSAGREPSTPSRPASDCPQACLFYKRKAAKRLRLLAARERRIVALLKRLRGGDARSNGTGVSGGVKGAICTAFGAAHCSEAIAVARCESGLNVWATNGQYVNLFQMGYNERRRYGWHVAGSPAIVAARAAYRYFQATGYSWAAWSCKP